MAGIQLEQSSRHLTIRREIDCMAEKSLSSRNQAKKKFLSGHGGYIYLFSQVKGVL